MNDPTSHEELHSSYQLAGIVLRVRDDIDVLVREYGGQPTYILEDELTSRYYRLGAAEYTFLSLLDGRNTFATALGRTAALMHHDGLTEDRAATFCKWLVDNGLASTEQSRSIARLEEQSETGHAQRQQGKWSALSQRIALHHPRKSIDVLERLFGWMFSYVVAILWVILVGAGVGTVALDWHRFQHSTESVIARDNWLWLIASWLLLKLIHECAHGVACRHFGGSVREVGVMLIVFIPLPYVDVSSAWRFGSKWQRIVTSAAGMMAELAIAAIAALVWSQSAPGLVSQNAMNLIVSAGMMTLLFNANPLMRFDGYYILTDLLELPNLYTHGQQALVALGRRWGLGLSTKAAEFPEGRFALTLAYGLAAFLWRITICVGLILAADALFFGLGTLLAVLAVIAWLVVPVFQLIRFVSFGTKTEQPSKLRFAALLGVIVALGVALDRVVPWYSSATAPVVVDYYPQIEIRSSVSGFVETVDVVPGQIVMSGQRLLGLRNDELVTRLRELEFDLELSRQRANMFLNRKEIPSYQVELENHESLEQRLIELQEQLDRLIVKAPSDGVVLDGDLSRLEGTYVSAGSLLSRLGPSHKTEVLAMVDQPQEPLFRSHVGNSVQIHVDGTGMRWVEAELIHVNPRAMRDYPHPALAANAGGPLEVRATNRDEESSPEEQRVALELVDPHFLARVTIPEQARSLMSPGMTGTLAFAAQDGSVGQHLCRVVTDWWQERKNAATRQIYRH